MNQIVQVLNNQQDESVHALYNRLTNFVEDVTGSVADAAGEVSLLQNNNNNSN